MALILLRADNQSKILNALAKKMHGDTIISIEGFATIVKNNTYYSLYKLKNNKLKNNKNDLWVPISNCGKSNIKLLNNLINCLFKPCLTYELDFKHCIKPIFVNNLEQLIIDLEIGGYLNDYP